MITKSVREVFDKILGQWTDTPLYRDLYDRIVTTVLDEIETVEPQVRPIRLGIVTVNWLPLRYSTDPLFGGYHYDSNVLIPMITKHGLYYYPHNYYVVLVGPHNVKCNVYLDKPDLTPVFNLVQELNSQQ